MTCYWLSSYTFLSSSLPSWNNACSICRENASVADTFWTSDTRHSRACRERCNERRSTAALCAVMTDDVKEIAVD